jgi:uncharacterized protein (TIGR03435 family)
MKTMLLPFTVLVWCVSAVAQQTPAPPISFEVVSVKPSMPNCNLIMIGPSEDGFHLHCLNLLQLVQYAYNLNLFESDNVMGLPKWASTEHFDLDAPIQGSDRARFESLPPPAKARLLRPVLADRFALRSHEEQREIPVYALIQGKLPLKLKPTDRSLANKPTLMMAGKNRIQAWHCSPADFASFITPLRGRPVIDRTGLTAEYDFTLDFAPETGKPPAPGDDEAPSIFISVQEQLGLRLIPEKAPMPVLVVEAANHPEAN